MSSFAKAKDSRILREHVAKDYNSRNFQEAWRNLPEVPNESEINKQKKKAGEQADENSTRKAGPRPESSIPLKWTFHMISMFWLRYQRSRYLHGYKHMSSRRHPSQDWP